jgi:predicted Fe-Mo cluster-binding NifX family protein
MIAVASDDGEHIAGHLGQARGFIIYEIEEMEITQSYYRKNDFTGHTRGLNGAGHSADRHGPVLAALNGCEVVISHGMGRRIIADLQNAGIKAYIVSHKDAQQAVQLYLQDKLANQPHLGCDH